MFRAQSSGHSFFQPSGLEDSLASVLFSLVLSTCIQRKVLINPRLPRAESRPPHLPELRPPGGVPTALVSKDACAAVFCFRALLSTGLGVSTVCHRVGGSRGQARDPDKDVAGEVAPLCCKNSCICVVHLIQRCLGCRQRAIIRLKCCIPFCSPAAYTCQR